MDVNDAALEHGSPGDRSVIERDRMAVHVLQVAGREAVGRDDPEHVAGAESMLACSARHSRPAASISVSNTACRSKVERLITLSTSAVAACCSSNSRSSFTRRTFSVAVAVCCASASLSRCCVAANSRASIAAVFLERFGGAAWAAPAAAAAALPPSSADRGAGQACPACRRPVPRIRSARSIPIGLRQATGSIRRPRQV